uniref:Uncharacterized protein n=1 Tax=Setaria viridis TaxID=4556 RepID=A0A4U6U525_SETVI|nr:hypothetical protein SEVIR_6G103100v2 [Setaria viridis]
MHLLQHKKLMSKQGAARGGSNQIRTKGNQGVQSNKSKGDHAGRSKRSIADGGKFKRVNTRRAGAHTESSGRSSADGVNSIMVADGGVNSTMVGADCVHFERNSANGASHGVNTQLNGASNGVNSQLNGASDGASPWGCSKKREGKDVLDRIEMALRIGRVELAPKGHRQFKYVAYNPKGLKYPSQVGAILKREDPGIIKVYDEQGNKLFTVHPRHRVTADKILEAYLVRRVSNMVYQLRLEAVKMYFHKREDTCDDTRARTIELTEEQYLTCRLEWCSKSAWAWFCKYWTSDEYKRKRKVAQYFSRNFSKAQQLLEHSFSPEKSGTLNTYTVMKSGFKTVDSTGRDVPIPSQKAKKCLDDYIELVSNENSQELDGKALHIVGNGMKHGHVPIGDGAVDKAIVLVHSKSVGFKPINPTDYDRVLKENEQLKETNGILFEENSVNRALIMTVGSPHGCSHSVDNRRNGENIDERDDDGNNFHEGDEDGEDGDDSDSEGNGDGNPDQEREVDEEAFEGDR